MLHAKKAISKQKMEEIFQYLFIYFFQRNLRGGNGIANFVEIKEIKMIDQIKQNIVYEFDQYFTLGQLRRDVMVRVANSVKSIANTELQVKT